MRRGETEEVDCDTVVRAFTRLAALQPDAPAISERGRTCSYAELHRRAEAFARALPSTDLHGRAVVVLVGRDAAAEIAGILGIILRGGVAVPLDEAMSPERLAKLFAHSAPAALALLAQPQPMPLASDGVPTVALPGSAVEAGPPVPMVAGTDDPAYVCYTSGSTGQPKGVTSTHRQLLRRAAAAADVLGLGPDERHTLLHSLSSGAGCATLWRTLLHGGCVLPGHVHETGVLGLREWIDAERATTVACAPTLFRTFVAALGPSDRLASVRTLRLGGEPVTAADFAAFRRHFPSSARFVTAYSITEGSNVALNIVGYDRELTDDPVPVGRPLADCDVKILDDEGRECEPGVVGEIVITSPYLGVGYWNAPELSATVFRSVGGGVELRTGDLGRMSADGILTLLGRKDSQVKIRGYRVEVNGVESVLLGAPGVRQAAVMARPGGDGGSDPTLVACLGVRRDETSPQAIRAYAVAHLPKGSVPHEFVLLDALPLTVTGKVDRHALPHGAPPEIEAAAPIWSGWTASQQAVARIWASVLGHSGFGLDDDFLAVGGDSLQAMRVLTRVASEQAVEIPLTAFLDAPTVTALAAGIESERRPTALNALLAGILDDVEGADPL